MKNLLISILTVSTIILLTGCEIYNPPQDDQGSQGHHDSQSGSKVKKGGPPAHAPAHGYRRKFGYTYYPSKKVYYSKEKETWFWLEKGDWKFGAKLPSSISLKGAASRQIELDADTPYSHYSKSKGKKKGKGKGKKKGKGKDKNK